METAFFAPDIACDACARSIVAVLTRQPGVEQVAVDVPAQTVTVRHDPSQAAPDALAALLDDAGFPAHPQE